MARLCLVLVVFVGCGQAEDEPAPTPAATPAETDPQATLEPVVEDEPRPPSYEVHEWGLVSVRRTASDGTLVAGPGRFQPPPARIPSIRPGPISARAPVIYVHLPEGADELTFTATLSVPGGRIDEHWPLVGEATATDGPRTEIRWADVVARPGQCEGVSYPGIADEPCTSAPGGLCEVAELSHYETPDGACLVHGGRSYDHLFYRASPRVELPVDVAVRDMNLVISGRPAGRLLRIRRADRRARTAVRIIEAPAEGASYTMPTTFASGDSAEAGKAMVEGELASLGLTEPERQAFLRAWDAHLFGHAAGAGATEPVQSVQAPAALRPVRDALLYFLPAEAADSVARLSFDPEPTAVHRAMAVLVDLRPMPQVGLPSGPHPSSMRRAPPRVTLARPTVRGSLSTEVIRRVMRSRLNQFRHCAQRAADTRNAELSGNVQVMFVINPEGRVITSNLRTDSTNSSVGPCIAQAVRRIAFPEPQGGGIVMVEQALEVEVQPTRP